MRSVNKKINNELSDLEDSLRSQIDKLYSVIKEMQVKLDELLRIQNEKKAILNIPMSFDDDPKKGNLSLCVFILYEGSKMDSEFIIEALEKMRDYVANEVKKIRDDLFKQHLEFETKVREKIDKKELEDIESINLSYHIVLERMMENAEISVNNKTKKFVDKTDMKKIRLSIEKQIENLFALI